MLTQPQWLLLVVLVPVLWLVRRSSAIVLPQLNVHRTSSTPWWAHIPNALLTLSFLSVSVALARPVLFETSERQVIESRDFVIGIDISGSMNEKLAAGSALQTTQPSRKIDAARDAARMFIGQREGDRVGLLLFDDRAYYSWPLSTDIALLDRKIQRVQRAAGGGTDFDGEDGAIQACINHLVDLGQSRSKVIILVSDGEDSFDKVRYASLVSQIKDLGARVYVLGVGDGLVKNSRNTSALRDFVSDVEGEIIVVADAGDMLAGFERINALERSNVEIATTIHHVDIFHYFLWAALSLLLGYLLLSGSIGQAG